MTLMAIKVAVYRLFLAFLCVHSNKMPVSCRLVRPSSWWIVSGSVASSKINQSQGSVHLHSKFARILQANIKMTFLDPVSGV